MSGERTRATGLALVLTVTVVASTVFEVLGVPSAVMFGSLLGGIVHALTSSTDLRLPPSSFRLGQALIGVVVGSTISIDALTAMGDDVVSIALVTVGTILISLAAGALLSLRSDVSRVTGAFAMIAGGASGVVAVARDLGADDRVVTVVQYLRVLLVLVMMPVITAVVFHPDHAGSRLATAHTGLGRDLLYVAISLVLGLALARLVPVTTSILLAPLAVAAFLASSGWLGAVAVPAPLQWLGFALIGVQVGLRFTRASLASITRMLPVVLLLMVGMIVATALMGSLLALLTPVDGLTAYLATTPGGLFAVLATAADAGSDTTFVMAVQLVRLLVILAFTPLLAKLLTRAPQG
ncbi:AbrB family transcriptional regulator [Nocardioides panacihumi]|uniref:AbrB family transcriptional regulator n=1 Tax=Nocardioides panacihumi TaxID=400774 RepID=A0ABP5CBU3_9ACTN